nr:hypothetical protein [Candidatus Sigynarchaeota archaeon]
MTTGKNNWDCLVGSQSCAEFMFYSVDHEAPFSDAEIEQSVDEYLNEVPAMFREDITDENWTEDDIAEARRNLIHEIKQE